MRKLTIKIPIDSASLSMGADEVASAAIVEVSKLGYELEIIRSGSYGMFWLEPLIEINFDDELIGFGPVMASEIADIISCVISGNSSNHPKFIGKVEDHPYLAKQNRITFNKVGKIDPVSLDDFENSGGIAALKKAAGMSAQSIVDEVTKSTLRGRGGAGFPAGIKWNTVLQQQADQKYVCCNADEGDSGTFADRMMMEGDPSTLIEGMVIAGFASGATEGYIYIRSEYPHAINTMNKVISLWRTRGWLGSDIFGSGRDFDLFVRRGAGAYICGEESSMLQSLEGKRGEVRVKPPIPAINGLFGKPTVINNVLTLSSVPMIINDGADSYLNLGIGRSTGTQPFQLAGNIKHGGLIEVPFGITLRELIYDFGGGTSSTRPVKAVMVGGPLGAYISTDNLDVKMTYEHLAEIGAMLGHGGIVVFDDTVDMSKMAQFAMEFCAEESCGKCTPCRIGSVRGAETIQKIRTGTNVEENMELLHDLCELMTDASLCAMGGLTPNPVISALKNFPEDFVRQ